MTEPRVGRTAFALGLAGLLPQVAAVAGLIASPVTSLPFQVVATVYPLLILSFLGGTWWAFAMRRENGQGRLAIVAVAPSLLAAFFFATFIVSREWTLVATGCALLLTLLVDRQLTRTGEAPKGWMALRVPLSFGLGSLTILAGVLFSRLPAPL